MTPEQYLEFLDYFKKNNSWDNDTLYENSYQKHRVCYKYVECRYDSRDNTIWSIMFYNGINTPKGEDTKHFTIESQKDIDEIYQFLNTIHIKEN